jgi:hypothetical protein
MTKRKLALFFKVIDLSLVTELIENKLKFFPSFEPIDLSAGYHGNDFINNIHTIIVTLEQQNLN